MDIADDELRDTIRMMWPLQADKMMDILVPRREKVNRPTLTTGKIYAGLLILESWRTTRFGKTHTHFGVGDIWGGGKKFRKVVKTQNFKIGCNCA